MTISSDPSSSEEENQMSQSEVCKGEICVITKEQDLLLESIDKIDNPKTKKEYLMKLKDSLKEEKKSNNFQP